MPIPEILIKIGASFKFVAKHPASALVCGGILMLILTPIFEMFFITAGDQRFFMSAWGLIILGAILNILWLVTRRRFL